MSSARPLSQAELVELCHRAKERAQSNKVVDRLYALIVVLHEHIGDNDPGELLSSNPSFRERCEETLSTLFRYTFDTDYRVVTVLNENLLDDADPEE